MEKSLQGYKNVQLQDRSRIYLQGGDTTQGHSVRTVCETVNGEANFVRDGRCNQACIGSIFMNCAWIHRVGSTRLRQKYVQIQEGPLD